MDTEITIVGCGPGSKDMITIAGLEAIKKGDVIVGSPRLIKTFVSDGGKDIIFLEGNYIKILKELKKIRDKRIVFLVSGDPLIYSLGELIIKYFGPERCRIIPGISSIQYAFAILKESWRDYKICSLHGGREVDIKKVFLSEERFVILLDEKHNIKFIRDHLKDFSEEDYIFWFASNLSLENETIKQISIKEYDKDIHESSLSMLIVRRKDG